MKAAAGEFPGGILFGGYYEYFSFSQTADLLQLHLPR